MGLRRKHIESHSITQSNDSKCHGSNCADPKRKRRHADKRRRQLLKKETDKEILEEGKS